MISTALIKVSMVVNGILLVACGVVSFYAYVLKVKNKDLSESLKTANIAIEQHEENILITEKASNDHQKLINTLTVERNRLRSRPAKCIPITR